MQEALQLLGFNFSGLPPNLATAKRESMAEQERYVVPKDRAISRPYMMGWLDLLGEDKELICGGN